MSAVAETVPDLERFLELVWQPGDVREVRVPTPGRTDSGYFDNIADLVRAVGPLDGQQNVYLTINPVDPALLGRANNRIKARVRATTSDINVVERRWLPIDIDPARPSDISSTDIERTAALGVAREVWSYLHGLGWPDPVTAMSGNGYWLLYPIQLPNDGPSEALVKGVLTHLGHRFGSPQVAIDQTVSNASRIVALIGTVKLKGDATSDRPHRRSVLTFRPIELVVVPTDKLAALVPTHADTKPRIQVRGDRMPAGWVKDLLDGAGISYREGQRNGRTWYRLNECPFHPDDDRGGDCGVGEDADGKGLGHCFHNRGAGKGWRDFRDALGIAKVVTIHGAQPVPPRPPSIGIDAADLLALDLPALRWVVPDLLPEGTTILAAPPKVGKSCFIYQVATEAAVGGEFLGRRVMPGSVLYLALEDGKRRGQDRLRVALGGRTMPRGRLEVRWDAPRIGEGLEEEIEEWLVGHPDAALVAVDTLGKVRPRSTGKQGAYEVDVQDLARLQSLFRDRTVALVIVHHSRKEASDDFLTSVSGTYGITGSADTIVVLRRKRLEQFGTVLTTGRDIADAEVQVQFIGGRWVSSITGPPPATQERRRVLDVIETFGPIFPQAIADRLDMGRTSVANLVAKLFDGGAIRRTEGGYVAGIAIVGLDRAPNTLDDSDDSSDSIPRSDPSHHSHQSHGGEVSRTYARDAREEPAVASVDPTPQKHVACLYFHDHQTKHIRVGGRLVCPICHPEDASS